MGIPDLSEPGIVHGSAVCLGAAGLLILGPSGCGKSVLALAMMALGCDLVADDRVTLSDKDGMPWLSRPPTLPPVIEARWIGLLNATPAAGAWARIVVDLSRAETERLPPERHVCVLGTDLPLVCGLPQPYFPAALLQFLKAGRSAS